MTKPLKLIRVIEHQPVAVCAGGSAAENQLTEEEAEWLVQLNEQRPGFCVREFRRVRFKQYCGIVRLPTCVIEVLPKTTDRTAASDEGSKDQIEAGRAALLQMLHYVHGFPVSQVGAVGQTSMSMPLLDVFIRHFLQETLALVKRGLIARYVEHEDNLTVLRGRLLVSQDSRLNQFRPDRKFCSFDELTVDNPYNQALRQTLAVVRNWIVSVQVQQLWFELWSTFAGLEAVPFDSAKVAALPRHRLVARYEPALMWCEWLLKLHSPALLVGSHEAPALLFDMNSLFEAYVAACVQRDHRGAGFSVHVQGPARNLACLETSRSPDVFTLYPDVTVIARREGAPAAIYDAKWKLVDAQGVSEKDMYQMLAYAVAFDCHEIFLVYPWIDAEPAGGPWRTFRTFRIPLPGVQREVSVTAQLLRLGQ